MTLAIKSLGLFELICDYPYIPLTTHFAAGLKNLLLIEVI